MLLVEVTTSDPGMFENRCAHDSTRIQISMNLKISNLDGSNANQIY